MTIKDRGEGELSVVARWDRGLTWCAHPAEAMGRTSHALLGDAGGVWLVDPVDAPGLDELLSDLGEVADVVVTSSWHARDADTLARRHDVAVHLHDHHDRLASTVDAPVERFEDRLAGTGFRSVAVETTFWTEVGLFHPDRGTLAVGDSLVATDRYTAPDERLAVLPVYRRIAPPRGPLSGLAVERVLVGHGGGVFEDATHELDRALAGARRHAPTQFFRSLPALLSSTLVALRD